MDLVIRFNKLQSYVCGDKFDVWASRHGDAVTSRYWGIGLALTALLWLPCLPCPAGASADEPCSPLMEASAQ